MVIYVVNAVSHFQMSTCHIKKHMKHHLNPQGGIVIHSLGYDEMFASAPFLKSIGNFVSFNLWKSLPTDFPHKVSPRRMDTNVAKFLDVSAKTHREQRLLCDSAKTNEHVFRETQNLCFHICVDPLVYQTSGTLHHWEPGAPPWHQDTSLVWFHQSMLFERKESTRGRERRESHLFSLLGTSGRLESIAEACESNSGGGLLTNKPFWVTCFNESLLSDMGENEKHTTIQWCSCAGYLNPWHYNILKSLFPLCSFSPHPLCWLV